MFITIYTGIKNKAIISYLLNKENYSTQNTHLQLIVDIK